MLIDRVTEQIRKKKNPCIVGLDPEWEKLPACYKDGARMAPEVVLSWAKDIIDVLADVLVAVKPQMAFYEVYGRDAMQPFVDMAVRQDKGLFVLVKTSNPGSVEISEARNEQGQRISGWLAEYVAGLGEKSTGVCGYSAIGAVVGATFPGEAARLRKLMEKNYFLVPGYGAQGGSAEDIVPCFCEDGLGALVSSSRGILYHYGEIPDYDGSRQKYLDTVRSQAIKMQRDVYRALKAHCAKMDW